MLTTIAGAVAGVLAGLLVVTDPEVVIVGGPWGGNARAAAMRCRMALGRAASAAARSVPLQCPIEASLAGARQAAVDELRTTIVARASQPG